MSEVIQRNAEEVEAIAASMGLVCFLPEPQELFLDLDKESIQRGRVLEVLEQNGWGVQATLTTRSKNGNQHEYIKLDVALGPLQRIALQAILGSDPVREVLSVLRLNAGATASTALFETKLEAVRVKQWRKKHSMTVTKLPEVDDSIFTNF